MCIVGRGWHGDTSSAPRIHVTQLIRQLLKTVCCEIVIIIQHVIVCRSACSLERQQQPCSDNNVQALELFKHTEKACLT